MNVPVRAASVQDLVSNLDHNSLAV